jgi:ABC-type cobalamin transport system ATPase subunit
LEFPLGGLGFGRRSGTPSKPLEGESIQRMCERKSAQKRAFMGQIEISGSDMCIVEYLAEVVKSQHEVGEVTRRDVPALCPNLPPFASFIVLSRMC